MESSRQMKKREKRLAELSKRMKAVRKAFKEENEDAPFLMYCEYCGELVNSLVELSRYRIKLRICMSCLIEHLRRNIRAEKDAGSKDSGVV